MRMKNREPGGERQRLAAIRLLIGAAAILIVAAILFFPGKKRAEEDAGQDPDKLRIVATIFPPYDFARQIGGDAAEVTMLLKPGMESHSYEPTPADIVRILDSDIFLYAGGESDVWVEELLSDSGAGTRAYAMLDWVEPLLEEPPAGRQEPEENRKPEENQRPEGIRLEEGEYDEHVWTSPQNAMLLVERICQVMSGCDPDHAEQYRENAERYQGRLQKLDDAMREAAGKMHDTPLIFGDRFPLLYFVKTYGLQYDAVFPGCSQQTEPSASTVAHLTDRVRKEKIPVVFYLELSSGKIADAVAEASGARTAVFYACHAISAQDLEAGEDYISLMYRNVEALRQAAGG